MFNGFELYLNEKAQMKWKNVKGLDSGLLYHYDNSKQKCILCNKSGLKSLLSSSIPLMGIPVQGCLITDHVNTQMPHRLCWNWNASITREELKVKRGTHCNCCRQHDLLVSVSRFELLAWDRFVMDCIPLPGTGLTMQYLSPNSDALIKLLPGLLGIKVSVFCKLNCKKIMHCANYWMLIPWQEMQCSLDNFLITLFCTFSKFGRPQV